MPRSHAVTIAPRALLPVLLLALGCDAVKAVQDLGGPSFKAGDKCTEEGKEVCQDNKNALVCHKGSWELMTCNGLTGCMGSGDSSSCNNDNASPGDVCNANLDTVCTTDKKARLVCRDYRWQLAEECLGKNGCVVNVREVRCDNSIAKADSPCLDEGNHACGTDNASLLLCKDGRYQLKQYCRGQHGCRRSGPNEIECNDLIAQDGDPCIQEGAEACGEDGKTLYTCQAGKMTKSKACKKSCKVMIDKINCN